MAKIDRKAKAEEPKKKYRESETITIKRSQINFAPYNPKSHNKKKIEEQKANIKRVGLLGGIIWNKTTSNLIDGHKRVMSLDLINGYDGTPETDYDVKVEMIELDEKTEREQNLFQTKAITDLDDELVRKMISDSDIGIDYKNAGLDDFDMGYYGFDLAQDITDDTINAIEEHYKPEKVEKQPDNTVYHPTEEMEESGQPIPVEMTAEEKIQKVKDAKAETMQKAIEKTQNMDSYFMVSFLTYENKKAFMLRAGLDPDAKMISGEDIAERTEFL